MAKAGNDTAKGGTAGKGRASTESSFYLLSLGLAYVLDFRPCPGPVPGTAQGGPPGPAPGFLD